MNDFLKKFMEDVFNTNTNTTITQNHYGTGNNIVGDKVAGKTYTGDKVVNNFSNNEDNVADKTFDMNSIIPANGDIKTKEISIENFDSIINYTSIPISVKQGIGAEVKLIGSSNLQKFVEFNFSKGGTMSVKMQNCSIQNNDLKIEIIVPKLILIELNSFGSMKIDNFNFKELEAEINSSGSLKLKNCLIRKLNIELKSSGSFSGINTEISDYVSAKTYSSGNFVLIGTETIPEALCVSSSMGSITIDQPILVAKATTKSMGNINLEVKESITGSCLSIGNIIVTGNPKNKEGKDAFIGKFKYK